MLHRSGRFVGLGRYFGTTAAAVIAATLMLPSGAAEAQPVGPASALIAPGNAVVTGFSGTRLADRKADGSSVDADGITLEMEGATLRILDISRAGGPGSDQRQIREIAAFNARTIGQVFGLTLDDAINPANRSAAPNIYTTASSAYGLNIVLPPATPTGWPRRTLGGDPTANWMAGQWGQGQNPDGTAAPGGPGSVWRIDGVTGAVSLFANITTNGRPNGGAGLGNIAYDSVSHQLFVSDLETGLIHRLDQSGNDLGVFDHGVAARTAAGLDPIPNDATQQADIHNPAFRSDDPGTWGYTHPSRRVWGLNISSGRLYYAVADGPEVWSVAIGPDGNFGDSRREITVPGDQGPFEVTDISFDTNGWIYLAQRPPVTGNYDYVLLSAQAPAKVLRYRPDPATNTWALVPDEFAVGLQGERRQADGGVALGYGYKPEGGFDYGVCDGTLWVTGDDLDRTPRPTAAATQTDAADAGTGLNVSGLQGSPADPAALTPENLRFVDFDGLLPAVSTRGHVGDVRVFRNCAEPSGVVAQTPIPVVEAPPAAIIESGQFDLELQKIALGSCEVDGICRVEVRIWNRGQDTFAGPLVISDTLDRAGATLIGTGPSRWICGQGGAEVSCHHPQVEIRPGRWTSVYLNFRLPARWSYAEFADCATIAWIGALDSPRVIYAVEIELGRLGHYTGSADGIAGPLLRSAIQSYEAAKGLPVTGVLNREIVERLLGVGIFVGGDLNPGNDRSCTSFHIRIDTAVEVYTPPPEPPVFYLTPPIVTEPPVVIDYSCPDGYWDRGGVCVRSCPWGYIAVGDSCVPRGGPVCSDGWFVRGQCTCPDGYSPRRGPNGHVVCRPDDGPHRCFGGYLEGDRCSCPWGTHQVQVPGGYACRPIDRVQCQGGIVYGDRCECPRGSRFIDGRCIRDPGEVSCYGGYRDGNRCICPNGTHLGNDGVCHRDFETRPCPYGEFRDGDRCVRRPPGLIDQFCPRGQVFRDGRCYDQTTQQCRPGEHREGIFCVPDRKPILCADGRPMVNGRCDFNNGQQCQPGWQFLNGRCVPVGQPNNPLKCPPGFVPDGNRCVVSHGTACPPGQQLNNGRCIPAVQQNCPAGSSWSSSVLACVPNGSGRPCPDGQQLQNGRCVNVQGTLACPLGQHQQGNRCVPDGSNPTQPNCLVGQRFENGRCVEVQGTLACPVGQHQQGNRCVPDGTTVQPNCLVGQRFENGRCVEVQGTLACVLGQHQEGNRCVPDNAHPTVCPTGQHLDGPVCVPNQPAGGQVNCPAGQHLDNGKCVADGRIDNDAITATCRKFKRGKCVEQTVTHNCSAGSHFDGKACVADTTGNQGINPNLPKGCPQGETLVNGQCRRPAQNLNTTINPNTNTQGRDCGPGQHFDGRRCVPDRRIDTNPKVIPTVNCPDGTIKRGNNCIPVTRQPKFEPKIEKQPKFEPKIDRQPKIEKLQEHRTFNNNVNTNTNTQKVIRQQNIQQPHVTQQPHVVPHPPAQQQHQAPCKKFVNGKCVQQ